MQQFASCDMKNSLGKKIVLGAKFCSCDLFHKIKPVRFHMNDHKKKNYVAKKKQSHQSSPCHPKWTVAVTCYLS